MSNLYMGSHAWLGEWVNNSAWARESERYQGLVVRSKSTAWEGISKYLEAEAGNQYTFSCYVKTAAALEVNIYLYHTNDLMATARFTVSQLTFSNLPVGAWTRVSITAECTQGGTVRPRVEARTDGVKLSVCGYQFEVGGLTDYSLPLITDRAETDRTALRALEERIKTGRATSEEVQQYLTEGNKGAYNASDLNRVEEAVRYVAVRMVEMGYPINLSVYTNWQRSSKPTTADYSRYFSNVSQLRSMFPVYSTTPAAPTADIRQFKHEKANDLEQILLDIEEILWKTAASWFFFGDLYMGEV